MSAAAEFAHHDPEAYWTLQQTVERIPARFRNVGQVRHACQTGALPALRIAGRWVVLGKEIDQHCRPMPKAGAPDNVTPMQGRRAGKVTT